MATIQNYKGRNNNTIFYYVQKEGFFDYVGSFIVNSKNTNINISLSPYQSGVSYSQKTNLPFLDKIVFEYNLYGEAMVKEGIISNFSSTNYLKPKTSNMPADATSFTFYTRTKTPSPSDYNTIIGIQGQDSAFEINSNNIRVGGSTTPSFTITANQWYWVVLKYDGTESSAYCLLDDGTYKTIEELPPLTETTIWTQASKQTSDIFRGKDWYIGYDPSYTGEFHKGSIDLRNTRMYVNDTLFSSSTISSPGFPDSIANTTGILPNGKMDIKSFNDFILYDYNNGKIYDCLSELGIIKRKGIFYNYTDTGIEDVLDAYYLKNSENEFILLSKEKPNLGGYGITKIGIVTINPHDLYTYNNDTNTWTKN